MFVSIIICFLRKEEKEEIKKVVKENERGEGEGKGRKRERKRGRGREREERRKACK